MGARANAKADSLAKLSLEQPILRLHQEDFCQALGVMPTLKYQHDGGPSPEQIAELLQANSHRPTEDVQTFAEAIAFNWLVGGTDAHAKNYSLLHGGGGRVRLAPLHDVASILPYEELDPLRSKLAMKIGSRYGVRAIRGKHWKQFAEAIGLDANDLVERVGHLSEQIVGLADEVGQGMEDDGIGHETVPRLVGRIQSHAEECRAWLGA